MSVFAPFIQELEEESKATRRLLELLPEDRLDWRPHQKSMSLGQLALHIASLPERISELLLTDGLDVTKVSFDPPVPESKAQILLAFEGAVPAAKRILGGISPEEAGAPWRLHAGGRELFAMPRIGVVRTILLNHSFHHRGQLTVYLRLLDVPLPITYGRSADMLPF